MNQMAYILNIGMYINEQQIIQIIWLDYFLGNQFQIRS